MRVRWAVAAATGWAYRAAAQLRLPSAADRQDGLQDARVLPDVPPLAVAGPEDAQRLRVVLLGNGPAESPGAASAAVGFPSALAGALAARTRRRVEVATLVGGGWDLAELRRRLHREQLHWHDALVVTAAYRPRLARVPLGQWASYTAALRAALVDAAGADVVIRVLSLPWPDAARAAPLHWGGLFGNRVQVMARIAESVLTPDQPAQPLRLHPPLTRAEWVGPAFSAKTYQRWAHQVADDLVTAWEAPGTARR